MFSSLFEKDGPRIVTCCGSGGVGKTTISATLGVMCAMAGKKTLVLTIDPARRLADSLGIGAFREEATRVAEEKLVTSGCQAPGELWAMMLDTKGTFDRIVSRYAKKSVRDKILANRYYRHLSETLAGSREYMAMEKLHELYHESDYDIIVLDTPPTRRALDFLDTPGRLLDLLGHGFFWRLFRPYRHLGRFGGRVFKMMASPMLKALSQVMGTGVLKDFAEFFQLWDETLFQGFRSRAQNVRELLSSSEALFFAVTSPNTGPMNEAVFLYDRLCASRIPFGGFIVNRVNPAYEGSIGDESPDETKTKIDSRLYAKLLENLENYRRLAQSDRESIRKLKEQTGAPIRQIPMRPTDVHDIYGLLKIREHLLENPRFSS